MSDDINNKIMQIAELLGQDKIPDNVKGLLSMLASSMGKDDVPPKANDNPGSREEKANRSEPDDNTEMFRKMSRVMDRVNTNSDPRINLLTAIRPFLNNSRQKRLNNCIKLLQMSRLTRLVDDNNNGY